jgi:hypothetical protein
MNMDFENTWSAVFRPGRASRYFDVHSQRSFERPMTSFSPINAWWLAEISRLVCRDDVGDAGGKTRNALLNEVGLQEVAFVSEGGAECAVVGPDAPADDGLVVVAFRGTDDLQAWLDFNLDLFPIEWRQGGRVHQGFKEAFDKRNLRDRVTGPPQELADHAPVNDVAHLERAV